MAGMSPREQHRLDLETIITLCRALKYDRIAELAENMLLTIPEESHCPNHPSDQICPECTS